MTPEFISDLVDEMVKDVDPEVIDAARSSLAVRADRDDITRRMVAFFETANNLSWERRRR